MGKFIHYGLPKKILLDQGQNFESQWLISMLMGAQKTNGQCERFNSTLIGMLGMLPPEKKSDFESQLVADLYIDGGSKDMD